MLQSNRWLQQKDGERKAEKRSPQVKIMWNNKKLKKKKKRKKKHQLLFWNGAETNGRYWTPQVNRRVAAVRQGRAINTLILIDSGSHTQSVALLISHTFERTRSSFSPVPSEKKGQKYEEIQTVGTRRPPQFLTCGGGVCYSVAWEISSFNPIKSTWNQSKLLSFKIRN